MPNAPIAGPMTSGKRGPKRSSNPPDQRDSAAIRTVNGKKAAPAQAFADFPLVGTTSGTPCISWSKLIPLKTGKAT